MNVLLSEVGLKDSENSGVGGGTPTVFLGLQPCPLDRVQGRTSCLCCSHSVDRRAAKLRPPSDEVRTENGRNSWNPMASPVAAEVTWSSVPRRSATPSRRPSSASGRSSFPPRSRLAAVAPEEGSGSKHQIVNGLFVERRRFVPVTTTRRLAATLVRGRSNPGEAVELFVEVGARVIGAMGPDEQDPCPRLALKRDDHSVLAPQVPNAQPLQGIRPGDPVAERCAAAPGEVVEEHLVGACRRARSRAACASASGVSRTSTATATAWWTRTARPGPCRGASAPGSQRGRRGRRGNRRPDGGKPRRADPSFCRHDAGRQQGD
jgi:hypothetical protein